MCFSATASFTAAAVLIPAGAACLHRASRTDRKYMAICALPLLLGVQQFLEGLVWIAGAEMKFDLVRIFATAYMFFSWATWPVWIPIAVYFLEPDRRRPIYLCFAVAGAMLGGAQYFPYLAHNDWLVTTFSQYAIRYGGIELFDLILGRELTYLLYVSIILIPLLMASDRDVNIFGVLVGMVMVGTYFFFSFAYISALCFGAAVVSLYLIYMIFRKPSPGGAPGANLVDQSNI